MAKEDIQYVRQLIAEKHGKEMTVTEVLDIINNARNVEINNEPGLLSQIRELRKSEKWRNGDAS